MTSDWRPRPPPPHPPNKDIDKIGTPPIGLVSSVGRAPARQSGGRRFKSRSIKFVFVHPKLGQLMNVVALSRVSSQLLKGVRAASHSDN